VHRAIHQAIGAGVNRSALACRLALALAAALTASACQSNAPPAGPEETCSRACKEHDKGCTDEGCWRGCNLILDRLAEHEGDNVVACVASAMAAATTPMCDDRTWARCAVRVGVHADGGPPAPPPPKDFEDEE
jgi:hypothetical protein